MTHQHSLAEPAIGLRNSAVETGWRAFAELARAI
jgi:hypothetical protein